MFAHLERLEDIQADTRVALEDSKAQTLEPLADIDPEVYAAAEDAFYAERGRQRYIGRDGRERWLTPDEIAGRQKRRKKAKDRSRYYGPTSSQDQRELVRWGFIVGSVIAGLVVVWLIVL